MHPVFHVSMLKRYHGEGNYIICWDSVLLDENLTYEEEPVAILDKRNSQVEIKRDCIHQSSMEESTRLRSHLGEGGGYARKIPTSVCRFRYSFSPLFSFL